MEVDEATGPMVKQLQGVCHRILPWLISVPLDVNHASL